MTTKPSLDNYIDVAERITLFKEKYPDGTLQAYCEPKIMEVGGKPFVVYTAAAYRTPEDHRPGIGTAWEPFPGPTAFTKDSEMMNAETAAWGRAIVAVGIVASRTIASRQEVQARGGGDDPVAPRGEPTARQLQFLRSLVTKAGPPPKDIIKALLVEVGATDVDPEGKWTTQLNAQQVSALIDLFQKGVLPSPNAQDIPSDLPEQRKPPSEAEWDAMFEKTAKS